NQIEKRSVKISDRARRRSFELIEGQPRLLGCDRVNKIRYGLRLHQIDAAVQKCPKSELARLREARSQRHRCFDNRTQNYGTAMCADFDDALASVRVRSWKAGHDDLITDGTGGAEPREQRPSWLEIPCVLDQSADELRSARAAHTDDSDAAAAGRRRD